MKKDECCICNRDITDETQWMSVNGHVTCLKDECINELLSRATAPLRKAVKEVLGRD